MIAALYVETNGVYYGLPDVDPWDEQRDARLYDGPWPVVAHPPCQRWCRFAPGIAAQYPEYPVGDDGGCFEAAVAAVRRFCGVLEHPAYSLAWDAVGITEPRWQGGWTASMCGGWTCYVEQGRYGLPVKKATWLYAYGVDLPELKWGWTSDAQAGDVRWARVRYSGDEERPRVRQRDVARTPPAFRDVLLDMARSCIPAPDVVEHAVVSDARRDSRAARRVVSGAADPGEAVA